jgi:hypothetical protein
MTLVVRAGWSASPTVSRAASRWGRASGAPRDAGASGLLAPGGLSGRTVRIALPRDQDPAPPARLSRPFPAHLRMSATAWTPRPARGG